jgi:RHS repeat-associated protein
MAFPKQPAKHAGMGFRKPNYEQQKQTTMRLTRLAGNTKAAAVTGRILILLLILLSGESHVPPGKRKPCVSCTITGTSPVTQGNVVTYTLSPCTATTWTCSCGTIQSQTSTSVTIYFNVLTCSSSVITALSGSTTQATKTVTVNTAPALNGGTISNPTQTINYNTVPAQISASAASGGTCGGSYTYQWYSSPDGTTFSQVSGATGQNYQPGSLTATVYYKRLTTCNSTAYTTNTAQVTVYPQLIVGSIVPASQNINYNTAAATLTLSSVSGGSGSNTFQWQSSPDNSTWTNISGATATTYSPGTLTTTTYYRVVVTSNGVTVNSSSAIVGVYLQLQAGSVSPATQNINYNTVPSVLSITGINGGNGIYTYQWQSSPDNSTWTNLSGVTTATYTPGSLTTTTYYRASVTSNGVTLYATSAIVGVYLQLHSGTVTPASQGINYNRVPATLTLSGTSGGNGIYSYSWQYCSTSNGVYTPVSSTNSTSYTPGPTTAATYFEVVTTSNNVSVTSTPVVVNVNGQVFPGTVNPPLVTIPSGTSPGLLSAGAATGGACSGSFIYQWQSSTNGYTYSNISGASGLSYTPGNLTALTYYRREVVCGTDTEYSTTAQVNIGTIYTNLNYIRVRTLAKPGITDTVTADGLASPYDVQQATQYFDGLGRPLQEVAKQASPLQNDMVSMHVYDALGREATKYLPYTATTNDGNYKTNPLGDQSSFNTVQFPAEQFYYGQAAYEPSPLNRVSGSYSPGNSWVGNGKGVSAQYLVNTAADSVRIWTIAAAPGSIPTSTATYLAGTLFKSVTIDEQGHQLVEYKDFDGHVVLKKVQLSASPGTAHAGWLNTYYVYDDLDNLRFVIQPQGVVAINSNWTITTAIANELCFRYEYDSRRRMYIKKIPGAGETWMVYDARDRVALSQDSSLRSLQKWMYTRYDAINRTDSTGLITDPTNYNKLSYHENLAATSISYPNLALYTSELLTQTYYDNYNWVSGASSSLGTSMATNYLSNSNYFITSYNASPTYAVLQVPFKITRGQVTGTMKKVIGTASQYLYDVNFYDDRGRSIQTQSINYTGAVDTATLQYDFSGKPLRTLLGHKKNGNTVQSHIVVTKMDYDAGFRVRHVYKNIDNAPSDQLIDSIQYNELGQLRAKYLGNNIDSLVYDYNIRGWLTGINKNYVAGTANHYFGMELGYDKSTSSAPGNTYTTQEYNGNIEGTVWKTAGSGVNRKYDFTYDNVNRLATANFTQYNGTGFDISAGINFSVSNLNYDANGNIQSMTQYGYTVGASNPIDQLAYTYQTNSNKLSGVTDGANNATSKLGDFHYNPATKGATDYTYDGNGNLITDNNKAIDNITYNYLNLPQLVHLNTKGNIVYTYDAAGEKLKKVTGDSTSRHSTTTLYLGGFVYQQTDTITNPGGNIDTLQFIAHEEGRARWAYHKYTTGATAYKFEYDFFEKDHLGNTRMVLTQEKDTSNYLASMEAAYRSTEAQLFNNIQSTSYAWSSVPGSSGIPSGTKLAITNPNDSVSKVDYNGTTGQKTGPSLLLKVMSGDVLNFAVQSYYNTNSITTTNSSFTDVLNSLAGGIVNTATGGAEGGLSNYTASGSPVYAAVSSFLSTNDPAPPAGYPKAYLNWVFLDDQFNYVSASSGAIAAANSGKPAATLNTLAPGSPLTMPKNGYLYIWVSNETQGWDVFFDNLSVQYQTGAILEENHYYPFGLSMAGISDKAVKNQQYAENKYRFNEGTELQNKEFSDGTGLEEYETDFRMYDPQIGRFWQVDPIAELFSNISPYSFANNNPVLLNDPLGLADDTTTLATVTVWGKKPKPPPPPPTVNVGPPPSKPTSGALVGSGNNEKPTNDIKWYQVLNDHTPGGDVIYEINKYNPLANVVNGIWTYFTGHDSYGVPQNNGQATLQIASAIPIGKVGAIVDNLVEEGASSLFSQIPSKIANQMARRGWTKELIHEVVNNPFTKRAALNRATGNAATAFFTKEGSYIVKDDITNEVIQVSDKTDPNWIPDATIVNPYKP